MNEFVPIHGWTTFAYNVVGFAILWDSKKVTSKVMSRQNEWLLWVLNAEQ